jgi:ubiquinone/menaquinone biosynthesis C-methylase UbiE
MNQEKTTPTERLYTAVNSFLSEQGENQSTLHYHLGFNYATEALADKLDNLGISSDWHVVDLCCGWGAPTRYLAERFDCNIIGLDLTQANIDAAKRFTSGTPLDSLITFMRGDARDIPLEPKEVDLIWSQDGFCHIPNRSLVFRECYRVLRPGGYLVFTDYLQGDFITEDELKAFSRAWTVIDLETIDTYPSLIMDAGFNLISVEEVGREYVVENEKHNSSQGKGTYLQEIAAYYENVGAKVIETSGRSMYLQILEQRKMEIYFAMGKLALGRFICRKPATV